MELKKDVWQAVDVAAFENELLTLKRAEKVAWTKRIINTEQEVLAIPTPTLRKMAKAIMQGNYRAFLDCQIFSTYESTLVHGMVLTKIENMDLLEQSLQVYAAHVDNWAQCDLLKFPVRQHDQAFLALAQKLVRAENLFLRRIGLIILFDLVDEEHIGAVLAIVDSLQNETEYYVNMAVAWLLCDCFIKQREPTWAFCQNHVLHPFVVRKFVSKCRDSYRVSSADKNMLRDYLRSKAL